MMAINSTTAATLATSESVAPVWRLETNWTWAPWFTAVFLLLAVALVVACYRWEVSPAGVRYRVALVALRLLSIAAILAMLTEAVYSGDRTGRPRLAIVLDCSQSMQRADIASAPGKTRERFAREALRADGGKLVERLSKQYELSFVEVAAAIETTSGTLEEVERRVAERPPTETYDASVTRLGDAIVATLDGAGSAAPGSSASALALATPLQGVLVISDGQSTAGASLAEGAEAARRSSTPLYLVGLGSERGPAELSLSDLVADDTAFVDDLVRFRATLRTAGMGEGAVRVDLLRDGATSPVASTTVRVTEDKKDQQVELTDRPTEPGDYRYTLRATAEVVEGTEAPPSSEANHTLRVRDGQVRVLLAAGYPNYEFRYLKQLLERDKTVRVTTFLQEADADYAEADLTAVPRMPTTGAELLEYDVLVLIDLDPTLLPRALWDEVASFVGESGGGLALVAGPRSFPVAYGGIPGAVAMSPTRLERAATVGGADPRGFALIPTPLGLEQSALLLADTPADSQRVWRTLPPLFWSADVGPAKPAAQVLAENPAPLGGGAPTPLIAAQFYGAGRVVQHAFDESYRWRFRVGDVYFARYWVQTLRTLARGKRDPSQGGLELLASARRYEPGETVRLTLRDSRPTDAERPEPVALLEAPGQPQRRVPLAASGEGAGRFQATITGLVPGRYRATVIDGGAGGGAPSAIDFDVVAPPGELARPECNTAGMMAAAERTRGEYFTEKDVARLAEALPPGRPTPLEPLPPIELWNRWPLLTLLLGALCAEWVLRKRRAML